MAGNSLQDYRSKIGSFNVNCQSSCPMNGHMVLLQILRFGLLLWIFILILLSGDIKLNPGPNLVNGLLLNTQSLKSVNAQRNKMAQLQSLMSLKNALVVCLTETWLKPDIPSDELFPFDSFNVYRKDRDGHGGVLVAIHHSIRSKFRADLVTDASDHNEIIVVELRLPKLPKIALVNFYRPPSDNSAECRQNFKSCLDSIRLAGFEHIWVMGDFNLPNMDPSTGLPLNNAFHCDDYYNIFQDNGFVHLVTSATHRSGNALDFIPANHPDCFTNINVESDIFPSDYNVVNFSKKINKIPRTVYNYRKADWNGLRRSIAESDLFQIIQDSGNDINSACSRWTNQFLKLINKFVPCCKVRNINSPPWIDGEVVHLSNKKDTAHRKAINKDTPEAWDKYKKLRNKLRNLII